MSKSIDNDDVACLCFWHGNSASMSAMFERLFVKQENTPFVDFKPVWMGIDWATDNGMLRGDVIKRESNVTHVRFKIVELKPDGTLF